MEVTYGLSREATEMVMKESGLLPQAWKPYWFALQHTFPVVQRYMKIIEQCINCQDPNIFHADLRCTLRGDHDPIFALRSYTLYIDLNCYLNSTNTWDKNGSLRHNLIIACRSTSHSHQCLTRIMYPSGLIPATMWDRLHQLDSCMSLVMRSRIKRITLILLWLHVHSVTWVSPCKTPSLLMTARVLKHCEHIMQKNQGKSFAKIINDYLQAKTALTQWHAS